MRRLLGLLLLLLATACAALPHLRELRDLLPSALQNGFVPWQAYAAAGVSGLLGLFLVCKRRARGQGLGDQAVRAPFQRRGFRFTPFPDGGWQADGEWQGEAISARWESGYHAGRFGRQWVLVCTLPGVPADPVPLSPTQAVVVERSADRFTVVLPEAGLAGGQAAIPERIEQLLRTRQER